MPPTQRSLQPQCRPDVVLMDIGMPGPSSFEAARLIRKNRPEARVIFLSMYDDDEYVSECVRVGASGYILKESPSIQLLTAIREVHRGGSYLSPRLLSRLVDDIRVTGRAPLRHPRFDALTKREVEVLKMLAEGASVKEIASEFDLSVKTIEAHKFNLMRKLGIHNKAPTGSIRHSEEDHQASGTGCLLTRPRPWGRLARGLPIGRPPRRRPRRTAGQQQSATRRTLTRRCRRPRWSRALACPVCAPMWGGHSWLPPALQPAFGTG